MADSTYGTFIFATADVKIQSRQKRKEIFSLWKPSAKEFLKTEIQKCKSPITLAIVQVGDNPASNSYIRGKLKDCEELGINGKHIKLEESISHKNTILDANRFIRVSTQSVSTPLPTSLGKSCRGKDFFYVENLWFSTFFHTYCMSF